MLTAAITAAVAAILALFGIKLSVGTLAVVALVVKLIIVFSGIFIGRAVYKRRHAAAEKPAEPENR